MEYFHSGIGSAIRLRGLTSIHLLTKTLNFTIFLTQNGHLGYLWKAHYSFHIFPGSYGHLAGVPAPDSHSFL